jgi:hypothetical protein
MVSAPLGKFWRLFCAMHQSSVVPPVPAPLPQDEFAVGIFQEVVRFHLLSEHELCEEEASSE